MKKDNRGTIYLIWVSFFLFLFPVLLKAQQPTFKNYSNVDGLPSNEIYMVLQDRIGYIWLATNYGVSRFDGYHFENFTTSDGLTDNTVFEIYEDFKGRIWFITSNLKFSYFDGEKIIPYKHNDKINNELSWIPYYENRSFYIDSLENLYFSVFLKGAYQVNPNGFIQRMDPVDKEFWTIIPITNDRFILNRSGENRVKNTLGFGLKNELNILKISNNILNFSTSFVYFSSKNVVYYSYDNIIYIMDKDGKSIIPYEMPDYIISVDEDCYGNIWVGLRNNGALCYLDGDISKPPFLHVLKGLPVSKIYADSEEGIWFSTTTNGVFYTPSIFVLNYTSREGLIDDHIYGINNCGGEELFVFYRNKRYNIIKDNTIIVKEENVPDDENIEFVQKKYSRKWIATNKMVYLEENGKTQAIIDKFSTSGNYQKMVWNAKSIVDVDSNLTYISFTSFIFEVSKNFLRSVVSSASMLSISSLCLGDNNDFYFGGKSGPGHYNKDTVKMLYKVFPELKVKVNNLFYDKEDKSLWIATKGEGIYILKENMLKNVGVVDGLASDYIKHIFKKDNQYWISTNLGINLLYKSSMDDNVFEIKTLNSSMGIISDEVKMVCSSGGKIYAATDKGLSFFDPKNLRFKNNLNKPVIITKIQINEKDTSVLKKYELPYNVATILISYKYLSYKNAGEHIYLYRLRGLSDNWQKTNSTEIRYTTLPPGEYSFEIKYLSSDKIPSDRSETIVFIINKPYWETWWFIFMVAFIALLLIYLLYRLRIKTLSNQNKLKLQLIEFQSKALSSQINPHFIFNSLNSIQLYVLNNDIVKSNKYLTKFSKLMRSVLDNSQDSSIILENEIKTITNYIEIEQMRFNNKFDYKIETDTKINIKSVRIPTLLIQPFIENAIWHGFMNKVGNGLLIIKLIDNDTTIKCVIQDNGIGRKASGEINARKSKTHKSLGAEITQQRLSLLNSQFNNKLEINTTDNYDSSGNPTGTTVELIIPKITK